MKTYVHLISVCLVVLGLIGPTRVGAGSDSAGVVSGPRFHGYHAFADCGFRSANRSRDWTPSIYY
jgi:hypothetical protein